MGERVKSFIKEIPILTLGIFIGALAVHFFLIPSKLIVGSITGLSIVINLLTSIPLPVLIFIINSFLLILSYFLIGKEFGIKTVYSALILSAPCHTRKVMANEPIIDAGSVVRSYMFCVDFELFTSNFI